jgi:hypothetical protein
MSKRKDKVSNQSKVFISFGEVSGSGTSGAGTSLSATKDLHASIPLYLGDDPELSILSKKMLKKDPVTKLKTMNELKTVLSTKQSHVLASFLPFFIYAYGRLCLEEQRAIREMLSESLRAIIAVEKRLLQPHMKVLIGSWWMLSGDPAPEVAEAAYNSFCFAIPPKKRQDVLVYLSPYILYESKRNVLQTPESLCDLSVVPRQEAEEKCERLLLATLASVRRLISVLDDENNLKICNGVSVELSDVTAFDAEVERVRYADFINDGLWSVCCSHCPYASVRKASYELISVAVSRLPDVFYYNRDATLSELPSALFCRMLLSRFAGETHGPNLADMLQAFVAAVRHLRNYFSQVSMHDAVIPAISLLFKKHPAAAMEFLLAIAGSFPSSHVALMDAAAAGATTESSGNLVSETDDAKSVAGLCDLVSVLANFAQSSTITETAQAEEEVITGSRKKTSSSIVQHALASRRRTQHVHEDALVAGVQADMCVVELSTLLLLRRAGTARPAAETAALECQISAAVSRARYGGSGSDCELAAAALAVRVEEVSFNLVQSAIVLMQGAAAVLGAPGTVAVDGVVPTKVATSTCAERISDLQSLPPSTSPSLPSASARLVAAYRDALQSVSRSLVQLQRATQRAMHVSRATWTLLVWKPLGDAVADLVTATSAGFVLDAVQSSNDPSERALVAQLHAGLELVQVVVGTFAASFSEPFPVSAGGGVGPPPSSEEGALGVGGVAQVLLDHVSEGIARAGATQQGPQGATDAENIYNLLMLSQAAVIVSKNLPRSSFAMRASARIASVQSGPWLAQALKLLALKSPGPGPGDDLSSTGIDNDVSPLKDIVACAVDDIAAFLLSERASAPIQQFKSICFAQHSIVGLSILCLNYNRMRGSSSHGPWSAEELAWVSAHGMQLLSAQGGSAFLPASAVLQLQFLLAFSAQPDPACGAVTRGWFVAATAHWGRSQGRLAEWYLLTLLAHFLQAEKASLSSLSQVSFSSALPASSAAAGSPLLLLATLPADLRAAVGEWVRGPECAMERGLLRLFFARIRRREFVASRKTSQRSSSISNNRGSLGGAESSSHLRALREVPCVVGWTGMQRFVLPFVPRDVQLSLASTIARKLNERLLLGTQDDRSAAESEEGTSTTPSEDSSNILPNKWFRHLRGLVLMLAEFAAQSSAADGELTISPALIHMFTEQYWYSSLVCVTTHLGGESTATSAATSAAPTLAGVTYAIACMTLIFSGSSKLQQGDQSKDQDQEDAAAMKVINAYLRQHPSLLLSVLLCMVPCSTLLLLPHGDGEKEEKEEKETRAQASAVTAGVQRLVLSLDSTTKIQFYSELLTLKEHGTTNRIAVLQQLLVKELSLSCSTEQSSVM